MLALPSYLLDTRISRELVAMRHYFDHASTSPLRPVAKEAMLAALEVCGDPGRIYAEALEARGLVEQSREQVAQFLGTQARSVVFTSGATEAIATVVRGSTRRGSYHVASPIEHSAVLKNIGDDDVRSTLVDAYGYVDPDDLMSAVTEETAVVHLQMVNHEVGTLQDVKTVASLCRERGVWLHVDAAQAVGHMGVSFDELGADFMSVSAHKFGGPAGVGALLVRRGVRLDPLLAGGDQERARRAGLENVVAIAGFGAVCESLEYSETMNEEVAEQYAMTNRICEELTSVEGVEGIGSPTQRAPHIACFHIADIEPQALVLELDRRGLAVHSGSACSSESLEPSPVLAAMGYDGHRSLRISVGWPTTQADVDALVSAVPEVMSELRSLRPG